MSRELNPSQIWSQVPVANRLIEVNTKTGFSLTAGSYSVRASSSQRSGVAITSATNQTLSISSVTTTRATVVNNGYQSGETTIGNTAVYSELGISTIVNNYRNGSAGTTVASVEVFERF